MALMSLLAGAGQPRAPLVFTLMNWLNYPLVGTWSQASIGTITLTQAGAYNVSISAQLSPESLRGSIFLAEVLYNGLKGTIVFPGIPVPESDTFGLFAVALVVLGLTFGRKPSRVSARRAASQIARR